MRVTLNGLQFWYDEVANYSAGQELLREGRKHGSIYLLKQGAVEIIKQGQRITTCNQRGDMFGEVSALTGEPCTTTVRVLEPSSFLVVEDANSFLSQNAQTALSVAKLLPAVWRPLPKVIRNNRPCLTTPEMPIRLNPSK